MYMRTIILTGMMGAGKSVVGNAIANKLSCKFFDLDEVIKSKENMSISDIFKNYGEKYFRDCEYKILEQIFKPENLVISLGGGAFENENIRDMVLNIADVIYLKTSPQVIYERIKNDTSRPLLKDNMSIDSIEELLNNREKNYKLATYTVITDNKSMEDVALEIIKCVC